MRDQVAELRDAGVQHLLCQTGFGDMSHEQNLASMRRLGEEGHTGIPNLEGPRRRYRDPMSAAIRVNMA